MTSPAFACIGTVGGRRDRGDETALGGPTAKAWNIHFASLFDQVADATTPPGNLWCGDQEARDKVETLNRDAGYQPLGRQLVRF